MGMYTNKKLIGKDVLEARYHNNALALYLPLQQDWKQAPDAVAALDEMIVWLSEVRDYVLSQSNITPKFMQVAFDARTIVECKAAALRGMAITEVRAITAMGLLFVRSALDIRWTKEEPFGAVRAGGEWIPLTMLGLETWAAEEGLNWRRDDGTVVLWQQTVGGGGGTDHKPLHSMTAEEARIYAIETHKRIKEMIAELNTIPGVNASSKLVVVFPDEERIPVLEIDDVMGDTYIVKTTDEAVSLVREMLEDWETFDVNNEIVVRVSLAHPDEIAALQMDDEGGAA